MKKAIILSLAALLVLFMFKGNNNFTSASEEEFPEPTVAQVLI
ncbi:hypothetical protein [Priestia koreensis]|nr:hypothetical protein [Priestia koreensis]